MMNAARSNHAAILLANGKVLIVGGATADLYDPVDGTFSPATSPGGSHALPTLSLLPDGRALLFGPPTLAGELYDPALDSWTFTAPASKVRNAHAAVTLGSGRVLIVGGHGDGIDVSSYSDGELFDPATNQGQGEITVVGGMSSNSAKQFALGHFPRPRQRVHRRWPSVHGQLHRPARGDRRSVRRDRRARRARPRDGAGAGRPRRDRGDHRLGSARHRGQRRAQQRLARQRAHRGFDPVSSAQRARSSGPSATGPTRPRPGTSRRPRSTAKATSP